VSVGETRAAQTLLQRLLEHYPAHHLLLTGMTPTGRATAAQVFAALGPANAERLHYAYLPYDYPWAIRRFLHHFRPQLGMLMETELWPNLLAGAAAAGLPVVLVNARLSARSARGYRRLAALARPALESLAAIAAQTNADAGRLEALGARRITVCGNLKFDIQPAAESQALGRQWRSHLAPRPVWLAASTREGEEALILEAYSALRQPNLLLLLVPRHPQRFDEVAALVVARGLSCQRRSQGLPGAEVQVWLGDSMGEMAAYYACADLALIGGSLLPFGGQNLIEAAACGCPVLVGPHTFNFAQAADDAVAEGAALRLGGAAELADAVAALLADQTKRRTMQGAALRFAAAHRGATERTLRLVEELIATAER
ncbi:MAG TPA: lipid IV(A) 3-deoxy-D-manno-octulosonic acid transferase, partial [Azospira sp.]|nr:lipid IV(A) 3-deoxy-D-manno-octulosonic acid transferase [Azospira sp.]